MGIIMNSLIFLPMLGAFSLGGGVVLTALVWLGIIGVLWWGFGKFAPQNPVGQAVNIVLMIAAVAVVIWFILKITGVSLP